MNYSINEEDFLETNVKWKVKWQRNTIPSIDFNLKNGQTKHTLFKNTAKYSKIVKKNQGNG